MLVKTTRPVLPSSTRHPMADNTRECPMCGGTMQLKQTTSVPRIPGYTGAEPKKTLEWVCPDCDYFEDADGENA